MYKSVNSFTKFSNNENILHQENGRYPIAKQFNLHNLFV